MKRRSFLAALFAAPMVPVVAHAAGCATDPEASKFVVVDHPDPAPLVFEDGILKLQDANIGQVTAGTIRSADDKMLIDLDNGYIRFS